MYVGMLAGQCDAQLRTNQGHKSTKAMNEHLKLFPNAKFLYLLVHAVDILKREFSLET